MTQECMIDFRSPYAIASAFCTCTVIPAVPLQFAASGLRHSAPATSLPRVTLSAAGPPDASAASSGDGSASSAWPWMAAADVLRDRDKEG